MKILLLFCFLPCLLPLTVSAQKNEVSTKDAKSHVNLISAKLSNAEIVRIEVINMPSQILTRTRITPEMLEKQFYYKLTIRDIRSNVRKKKLLEAVRSIVVLPQAEMPDIRWGIIFYDVNDSRVGAIYFDKKGGHGAVEGVPVSFKGDLFKWLDENFSSCFR